MARANGCEWDAYTRANAAEGGHLEELKWAQWVPANGWQQEQNGARL